jgi:hypothetical protein
MDKDFNLRIHKALKGAPDMRKRENRTSDYTPPALGIARARLVGYFEMGKHEEEYEVFELSGPNHPLRVLQDGTLIPHRVTVQETLSLDGNADFFNLFASMNVSGRNSHMAHLLGDAFIVEVFHRKSKDGKKVYAGLKGPNGYNVHGTTIRDPLSGKTVVVDVPLPITEIKYFIWNTADQEMWDSIYIPGEWEARKSDKGEIFSPARCKNVLQEKIRKAKNWGQHPLASLVS